MKSLERVRRSIAGKKIDYLPFFPEVIAAACQMAGVNQSSYSKDSEIMANALIAVRERCDYDGIYVSRDNLVLHQALGGEVVFPVDDEPFSRQTLVGSVEEYRKLSIPSPEKAPG